MMCMSSFMVKVHATNIGEPTANVLRQALLPLIHLYLPLNLIELHTWLSFAQLLQLSP